MQRDGSPSPDHWSSDAPVAEILAGSMQIVGSELARDSEVKIACKQASSTGPSCRFVCIREKISRSHSVDSVVSFRVLRGDNHPWA